MAKGDAAEDFVSLNFLIESKNKILDAAELLFAEHGFAETSLRTITTRADVNLAAVNYHFGRTGNQQLLEYL